MDSLDNNNDDDDDDDIFYDTRLTSKNAYFLSFTPSSLSVHEHACAQARHHIHVCLHKFVYI